MSSRKTFNPDYAVPPGVTLQETISELGMSQQELSRRLGLSKEFVNNLIKGRNAITPETAIQLEKVTGVPASFWNNLESNYRERLARLEEQRNLETQVEWTACFSYTKMASFGFVEATRSKTERVDHLLRFFGVASHEQWSETYASLQGAARESVKWKSDPGDFSAWIRAGELLAQRCDCASYDANIFKDRLQDIRKLTQTNPVDAWPKVTALCAESGVAVVLVPELPKTHVSGFTRWLTPSKALVQLSLRYKTDDSLWFTFFHEAAHILLHGKKDVFIEYRGNDSPKEREADDWASKTLIAEKAWQAFCQRIGRTVSALEIRQFARKQGIAPSIVVGRLHKEQRIPYNHHQKLKHRIDIAWQGLSQ